MVVANFVVGCWAHCLQWFCISVSTDESTEDGLDGYLVTVGLYHYCQNLLEAISLVILHIKITILMDCVLRSS